MGRCTRGLDFILRGGAGRGGAGRGGAGPQPGIRRAGFKNALAGRPQLSFSEEVLPKVTGSVSLEVRSKFSSSNP